MRRAALWMLTTIIILAMPTTGANAAADDELLIGTDWPYNASEEVKALFHEAGFNFVRVAGGGYAWSAERHTRTVAELEERGVKVLLQLGSHYPSGEYFQFRDSWFVDHKGETGQEDRNVWAVTYSGKAWPQYSYAGDDIRRQFEVDFAAYLEQFRRFSNVIGVNLHNEPGLHWLRDRLFDYSPPAVREFRAWLRDRYGDVARLNDAWDAQFESFDDVEPPRQEPPVDNIGQWMDWRRANVDFIGGFLRWEADLVRRLWPDIPLTTNMAGPLDWWHAWRCADNFLFSEGLDVAGIDIYPGQWGTRWHAPFTMDMTRGVAQGRPMWVIECEVYSPQKFADLTAKQRADLLRSEMWTYIGHGARGILLWGLTGRGENDLTRGEYNGRLTAMREITHASRMLRLGRFRPVPARVAVVVDPDAHFYYAGVNEEPPYFLDKSGAGMYAALRDAGYEADVLLADQVRRGAADEYDAVVLSVPVVMGYALHQSLAHFVNGGGLLIAEAPFGEVGYDGRQQDRRLRGMLSSFLGVRARPSDSEAQSIRAAGAELSMWQNRRDVEPAGADVIGRFTDGQPAVTIKADGEGHVAYIGATVSVPYADGWGSWARPGLRTLLTDLIQQHTEVPPPVTVTYEGEQALDIGLLEDDSGNRALVLSLLSNRGEPLTPIRNVTVHIPPGQRGDRTAYWGFFPTEHKEGSVGHGPSELPVHPSDDGGLEVKVGTVESAAVVLMAQDMPPLLAIEAPARASTGETFPVRVELVNLSPRSLTGELDLVLPESLRNVAGPQQVDVRSHGAVGVTLQVAAGPAAERVVLKARFTPDDGAPSVSVPVDVYVE